MDTYIYLLLSVPFLAATAIIYVLRKDLRRFILKIGILGGITGLISEIWYFQDYWRPPSLFGVAVPSIEDFLFGFGVVALGAVAPLFIFRAKQSPQGEHNRRRILLLAGLSVAALILLTSILHVNSIVTSYIIFIVIAVIGLLKYPHLWKQAVVSGVVLVIVASLTYAVLFLVLSPDYIGKYFLLFNHSAVPIYFGFMPITEVIWYFTWGLAVTVMHDLIKGKKRPAITSKVAT
jgi:hypothetical protein